MENIIPDSEGGLLKLLEEQRVRAQKNLNRRFTQPQSLKQQNYYDSIDQSHGSSYSKERILSAPTQKDAESRLLFTEKRIGSARNYKTLQTVYSSFSLLEQDNSFTSSNSSAKYEQLIPSGQSFSVDCKGISRKNLNLTNNMDDQDDDEDGMDSLRASNLMRSKLLEIAYQPQSKRRESLHLNRSNLQGKKVLGNSLEKQNTQPIQQLKQQSIPIQIFPVKCKTAERVALPREYEDYYSVKAPNKENKNTIRTTPSIGCFLQPSQHQVNQVEIKLTSPMFYKNSFGGLKPKRHKRLNIHKNNLNTTYNDSNNKCETITNQSTHNFQNLQLLQYQNNLRVQQPLRTLLTQQSARNHHHQGISNNVNKSNSNSTQFKNSSLSSLLSSPSHAYAPFSSRKHQTKQLSKSNSIFNQPSYDIGNSTSQIVSPQQSVTSHSLKTFSQKVLSIHKIQIPPSFELQTN